MPTKKAVKVATVPVNLRRPVLTSLLEREFSEPWSEIGLGDLNERDRSVFETFKGFLPPIEFNDNYVLLAKADAGGSLEQIYRIGIYRDGDEMILMVGGNQFSVTQEGGNLICGQLKGLLKTEVTNEKEGKFAALCTFRSPAIDDTVYSYEIRVVVEKEIDGQAVTKEDIEGVIAEGTPLIDWLSQKPVRAGKMVSLILTEDGEFVDLPREFSVKAVAYTPANPETGVSDGFVIQLENGSGVYASGNCERLLRAKHQAGDPLPGQDGETWKLVISEATKMGDDKFQVRNRLSKGVAIELSQPKAA